MFGAQKVVHVFDESNVISRLDISLYTRPKSVIAICQAARSFPSLLASYLVRNKKPYQSSTDRVRDPLRIIYSSNQSNYLVDA